MTAESYETSTAADDQMQADWLLSQGFPSNNSTGFTPRLYADVGLLLSGGAPEPPQPTIGNRTDGLSLIYPAAANVFFGPPESGKTLAASCVAADELFADGAVLIIDIDHNGAPATIARFRSFGIGADTLSDTNKFRYAAPEDSTELLAIIEDTKTWAPALCVLDSIGELLPMFGANSNDADDYTRVHRAAITPFTLAGTAVLAIDHEAKGTDSRSYGSSGTAAKKRAVDGAMLRFTVKDAFAPGRGGKAALTIAKDRHGALRANSPHGEREPLAAVFQLIQNGEATNWKFWAPKADDTTTDPTVESDAAELDQLNPKPRSVRDVQARLKWSPRRAAPALAIWREKRYPTTNGVTR
ncbi:hypothetical protein [Subtercola lobariae]|uniref:AAA family ATPase n=1 Tax=Subtercola lobariae TaxID=1588641 RepID=A0A917AZV7_9MICO|nr:hypothetical protein [Subtercola lobariae]GGF11363.1 hypothetical protein GCM10011399_01490 [Subtercola lobariae]